MPEASVGRVAHLAQAVRTHRDIRRHQSPAVIPGPARDDLETGLPGRRHIGAHHGVDAGHRRRTATQCRDRRLDVGRRALEFAVHRPGVVVDEAAEPMLGGDPRDRRAESDALHHPGDVEAHPAQG